jgi:DNA-binding transcriptional ArsR family regulator|tara:strand:+ start:1058 stop:1495 length:438 start_codon:yes stop_codon:yes gene_type:complete
MVKKSLRDIPLQEITLRKYESPYSLDDRELSRKFLLSIGLLQPGESRDIIVDIFELFVKARKLNKPLEVDFIVNELEGKSGASAPNVSRQIKRLKDMKLIEKIHSGYRITEFGKIDNIVSNFVIPFVINQSSERLIEYAKELDRR